MSPLNKDMFRMIGRNGSRFLAMICIIAVGICFVTGVGGQLGHDVVNKAVERGYQVYGSDLTEKYCGVADGSPVTECSYIQLDITDRDAVGKTISKLKPDVIVHCAAWTAVDAAEDDENRYTDRR